MARTNHSQDSLIELGKVSETSCTVLFLHGLGDSASGWFQPLFNFRRKYAQVRVVLPTAYVTLVALVYLFSPVQPVTVNGGARMTSWHDIVSLETIDSEEFKGLETSVSIGTILRI